MRSQENIIFILYYYKLKNIQTFICIVYNCILIYNLRYNIYVYYVGIQNNYDIYCDFSFLFVRFHTYKLLFDKILNCVKRINYFIKIYIF